MADWTIPIECSKCCWCRRKPNIDPIHFNFDFSLPALSKQKVIRDYKRLTYNAYATRKDRSCWACVKCAYQKIMFIFYLILLSPLLIILLAIAFAMYIFAVVYVIIKSVIIRCYGSKYDAPLSIMKKGDDWTYFSVLAAETEEMRMMCYKMPLYIFPWIWLYCSRHAEYLSGHYSARLISDDVIIYFVHLWSTMTSKFVYDDNGRIIGINEDYSLWSCNESVARFHEGLTFEILSVFIDYEDDCRITVNLRNGESIKQPRYKEASSEEVRVWNIVKAHYQCQLSIWPGIVCICSELVHSFTMYVRALCTKQL